jgi:hypothetical protein
MSQINTASKTKWVKTSNTYLTIWTAFVGETRVQITHNAMMDEYTVRRGGAFVRVCGSLAEAKRAAL